MPPSELSGRYRLGDKEEGGVGRPLDSKPSEKDLGVLVDDKLEMSWQYALAVHESKSYPGLHQGEHAQQVR